MARYALPGGRGRRVGLGDNGGVRGAASEGCGWIGAGCLEAG